MTVMRTEVEIQKAHDVMEHEVSVNALLEPELRELALAGLNVLCWVLGHKEGEKFERLISGLTVVDEAPAEAVN